jgi:hypothetical protein
MELIILILGVLGYIIYNFYHKRDAMLARQVDAHGGMSGSHHLFTTKLPWKTF